MLVAVFKVESAIGGKLAAMVPRRNHHPGTKKSVLISEICG